MSPNLNQVRSPLLRGYLHLVVAIFTPYCLVHLLLVAGSPRDFIGGAIFGASLILIYTTSAAYHVIPWNNRYREIVKRLDHSMIFLFIAGTYTLFALILLGNAWGVPIISVVWALSGIGILMKITVPQTPRWLGVSFYLSVGWIGLIPAVEIAGKLPIAALVMLVAGGLLYSVGSLIYLKRWPDPYPHVFGFHEVFHTLVVVASALFYYVVVFYVLPV